MRISISILILLAAILPGKAEAQGDVYLASLEGDIITPVTASYLERAIEKAEKERAVCLVIQMDTPGGLLEATRNIVKNIINAPVPIVVYVAPGGARAGSAGVFITLAAHIAAMAPSTNIGAAHPVTIGGEGTFERFSRAVKKDKNQDDTQPEKVSPMADKIMQDTVAWIRSIADLRGRNAAWAEKAVTESKSDTETAALEMGVIDFIAYDIRDLLSRLHGKTVKLPDREIILNTAKSQIKYIPQNFRERILKVIVNPNIAYILLILGLYGIIFEFTNPGIGFSGIVGGICIILALYSFQVLPTDYTGLILIVLGIIFFIAEARVISYGLLTLGGTICMFFGSMMLFDSQHEFMRISLSLILSLVLATAGITIFLFTMAFKAHRRKVHSGREGMIGLEGEAESDLNFSGKVFIHGELWNAISDEHILKGEKIIVTALENLTLTVRKK